MRVDDAGLRDRAHMRPSIPAISNPQPIRQPIISSRVLQGRRVDSLSCALSLIISYLVHTHPFAFRDSTFYPRATLLVVDHRARFFRVRNLLNYERSLLDSGEEFDTPIQGIRSVLNSGAYLPEENCISVISCNIWQYIIYRILNAQPTMDLDLYASSRYCRCRFSFLMHFGTGGCAHISCRF